MNESELPRFMASTNQQLPTGPAHSSRSRDWEPMSNGTRTQLTESGLRTNKVQRNPHTDSSRTEILESELFGFVIELALRHGLGVALPHDAGRRPVRCVINQNHLVSVTRRRRQAVVCVSLQ